MSLFNTITNWVDVPSPLTGGLPTCPECGAELDEDYVRAPSLQNHWRGVLADVCPECDYTKIREETRTP